ncbi:uncharacterized protein ColSpa_09039 [Colletotrichum spaethianum]|uniref:Uncharacterized protein n=1 Tax=Colletotrichum spaethianum TaxID=700344 RepID=A0AA37URW9_9PEZI|nr:uncharacterized protein ColSpa_09039 [Colletotrichum spaethianum]GKT48858.1 hypothetical protein ColSpa_09039 [Colletotrichum spaethianum]
MGLVDAKNKVPELQKFYQTAYKEHTRLWKICETGASADERRLTQLSQNPRSRLYMTPYVILLWGTLGVTFYGAGRKVLGYNTYFGKN